MWSGAVKQQRMPRQLEKREETTTTTKINNPSRVEPSMNFEFSFGKWPLVAPGGGHRTTCASLWGPSRSQRQQVTETSYFGDREKEFGARNEHFSEIYCTI